MPLLRFPAPNLDRLSRPWTRFVEDFIQGQNKRNEREEADALNANKAQASASQRQAQTIRRLPFVVPGQDTRTGFGLVAGWNTVALVTIPNPEGWDVVSITAIANVAALDTTSGGLTICEGRLIIGAYASNIFSPSKDSGASAVNNVLSMNFGTIDYPVFPGVSTTCSIQLSPLNPTAFPVRPSNYASLTVTATFTNPS